MTHDKELEELRRQLAAGQKKVRREESKVDIEFKKSKLRKQLFLLKHPKKVALAKRFGRGLKVTAKKIGIALVKQGRLIAAQQERDRRLEVARTKTFGKPVRIRKGKKKKRISNNNAGGFDPFKIDF